MRDDLACGVVVYQLHFGRRVGDRVTPFFTKVSDSIPNALAFCCFGASGIVRNFELECSRGIDGRNPRLPSLCSVESGSSCFASRFMEYFLDHAKDNTEKGLETCRILGAFLTHLSQSCFISSVDWHTHYSCQVMIPEAFAIVDASSIFDLRQEW
ncbi:AMSH-like ubiquitin thioesterase 2 [Pyrus ussuriensis x Pyrus communis]|uniref:AMSH-like ubiquitin thioesterase 2 n=1 Tax=Pyrus ussuriensis x Pyrus communis TaxID=2448454 RepID=A0A5N5G3B9_9ROSA|nr:AMSH-like ubiquitin thioesterase 2 [Pyrus ussuriensis x Pyrus communis]